MKTNTSHGSQDIIFFLNQEQQFYQRGKQEEAIRCLIKAIEYNQECWARFTYRGDQFAKFNYESEAIRQFMDEFQLSWLDFNSYLKTIIYNFLEQYTKANSFLNSICPNENFFQKFLSLEVAIILQGLDHWVASRKHLNMCLKIQPKLALAWFYLGKLESKRNNKFKARICFSKCILFQPTFAEAFIERAQMTTDSLYDCLKALKLQRGNPFYLIHCGLCYQQMNKIESAYDNFLEAEVTFKVRDSIKKMYWLTSQQTKFIEDNLNKMKSELRNRQRRRNTKSAVKNMSIEYKERANMLQLNQTQRSIEILTRQIEQVQQTQNQQNLIFNDKLTQMSKNKPFVVQVNNIHNQNYAFFNVKNIQTEDEQNQIKQTIYSQGDLLKDQMNLSLDLKDKVKQIQQTNNQNNEIQNTQINRILNEQKQLKDEYGQIKKTQDQHSTYLKEQIEAQTFWQEIKQKGNEDEYNYCRCLYWKLCSYMQACFLLGTGLFEQNSSDILGPSDQNLLNYFQESAVKVLKYFGIIIPSLGSIGQLIGEALQTLFEYQRKTDFAGKIEKIIGIIDMTDIIDIQQLNLQITRALSILVKSLHSRLKTQNSNDKITHQVQKIYNQEQLKFKSHINLKAIEDCLYILYYFIDKHEIIKTQRKSLSDTIIDALK